jgi:hypothetical protein
MDLEKPIPTGPILQRICMSYQIIYFHIIP